jgi:hypothetical protein
MPAHDLASDPAGGVWVSGELDRTVVHVDAAGAVRSFALPDRVGWTDDVAAASERSGDEPSGRGSASGWFAAPSCRLLRVTPAGELTTTRAPVHVDPSGGLWLRGEVRLAHLAPGERAIPCDTRAPSVRITPGGERISLRRLRRLGAFTVREPVSIKLGARDPRHRLQLSKARPLWRAFGV